MTAGEWTKSPDGYYGLTCSTCLAQLVTTLRSKFAAETVATRAGWRNVTRTKSICPECPHPNRDSWTSWLDAVEARGAPVESTRCAPLHGPGAYCASCGHYTPVKETTP